MAVLEELRELAPVKAVAGNMDQPEVKVVLLQQLTVEGGQAHRDHPRVGPPIGVEEGSFRFSGMDVIVFGHTHKALVEREGTLLVNPGSPNDRRFSTASRTRSWT